LLHSNAPPALAQWIASAPAWLVVDHSVHPLSRGPSQFDSGEFEAIALAADNRPNVMLLIDEERGREEPARLGIRTTSTLGILDAGAANGFLDLRSALQDLRATNFYVNPKLITRLLEKDASRRKLRSQS
jgi:predicted nucleic acid-binding protein